MSHGAVRILTKSIGLLVIAALPLAAQTGTTPISRPATDAQMSAMAANAQKMQHPAEFALSFTKELNLRPDQVTKLQQLVLDQRDSSEVRLNRPRTMPPSPMNALTRAMTDWGSPIDEQAIREAACEQSRSTSEIMLYMIRDQHAVGALLTEAQRNQIPLLQMQAMMKGMPGKP